MDKVRAPYNFVPLSPKVVLPDWADVPAWDVPFQDGICGNLDIELEAHTPLFVRGRPAEAFFSLPDGRLAVPGSSVRGMIRNVVEIAGFGKLGRFNDHRYGVRDLHNRPLYLDHMAALMVPPGGHTKVPIPLVEAGWLRRIGDEDSDHPAEITPCDFAKIHYRDLMDMARKRDARAFNPGGRRQTAPDKYKSWGAAHGEESHRQVKVGFKLLRPILPTLPTRYGLAQPGGSESGILVFTGQPQVWRQDDPKSRAKQHDFVFFEPTTSTKPARIGRATFRDFEFIHADRGQQGRMVDGRVLPNDEWGFWRKVYDRGERVPIFFLRWPPGSARAGEIRAFGLAMMFRLAYDHTIGTAIRNGQPLSRSSHLDLPDIIFGNVLKGEEDKGSTVARRGRVSFSMFQPTPTVSLADQVKDMVLGAPKASYYPNYIEQGPGQGDLPASGNGTPVFMTLMLANVRARGWKRYRPQETVRTALRPTKGDGSEMDLSRVATRFTPVGSGSIFQGRMRVHNLRPEELGALLWALDFGGEPGSFHTMGLAKSFGYGRVTMKLTGSDLRANDGGAVDLDACRKDFQGYMEDQLRAEGGWRNSVQIKDLLALSKPIPESSDDGRHMQLRHARNGNEFQEAKKLGLALAPVGREQGRAGGSEGQRHVQTRDDRAGHQTGGVLGSPNSLGGQPVPQPSSTIRNGSKVKAKLTGQNDKGKWRVELVDNQGIGVVGQGTPPTGLEVGSVVDVVVTSGSNPRNLGLQWP